MSERFVWYRIFNGKNQIEHEDIQNSCSGGPLRWRWNRITTALHWADRFWLCFHVSNMERLFTNRRRGGFPNPSPDGNRGEAVFEYGAFGALSAQARLVTVLYGTLYNTVQYLYRNTVPGNIGCVPTPTVPPDSSAKCLQPPFPPSLPSPSPPSPSPTPHTSRLTPGTRTLAPSRTLAGWHGAELRPIRPIHRPSMAGDLLISPPKIIYGRQLTTLGQACSPF